MRRMRICPIFWRKWVKLSEGMVSTSYDLGLRRHWKRGVDRQGMWIGGECPRRSASWPAERPDLRLMLSTADRHLERARRTPADVEGTRRACPQRRLRRDRTTPVQRRRRLGRPRLGRSGRALRRRTPRSQQRHLVVSASPDDSMAAARGRGRKRPCLGPSIRSLDAGLARATLRGHRDRGREGHVADRGVDLDLPGSGCLVRLQGGAAEAEVASSDEQGPSPCVPTVDRRRMSTDLRSTSSAACHADRRQNFTPSTGVIAMRSRCSLSIDDGWRPDRDGRPRKSAELIGNDAMRWPPGWM